MSTGYETFFYRLKEERLRLGFSQARAGEICDTSREVWGRYEAGKNMPGGDVLLKFTEAGADINYLFLGVRGSPQGREDLANYDRRDIDLIVDAYAHTDDTGRAALLAVAKVLDKKLR